ncbi:MAG: hypothetical protein KAQ69_02150 [Spirochaetales bacterium]|nr:hypothetical protein [Spirochaetales bacterium]
MSMQMKRAIINLVIWVSVTLLFLIVFFSGNTVAAWGDNRVKIVMLASLLGIGYIGQLILSIVFRKRKNIITTDERDVIILNKAMSNSFIVTLIYLFLVAMALYLYYEKNGFVPVAWLWFIAYNVVMAANITTSGFLIFHHHKGGN